ncbi:MULTISPECIES: hypothetical protein [Aliagarivorans]|uniref:hypothetical protein n=1 Tax=Aliagarivorans TaxID=882379 RepID=UPI000403759A|nr:MULTISPECIES: hypothetical protein [Aliagarivorans]
MSNKLSTLSALLCLGLASGVAQASDQVYMCKHGSAERIISVVYHGENQGLPCEVTYQKDGSFETLWRAQNTEGYCEEKAIDFVQKQIGWGWDCEAQQPAVPTQLPELSDESAS